MTYTSTVTTKGQITIPVEIRRWLQLQPHQRVTFIKDNDQVVIKKSPNILDLMGSLKSPKSTSDKDWDQAVIEYVGQEYAKKHQSSWHQPPS